ncbi:hypothetical protein HOI83_04115 [Candidatus Uhrbacteria bacterium]|jgi:uridine kinase|nr:hypothetical protein [Candidatus Uhrbacteria bacterium]
MNTYLIGVAGPSGAGKSVFCRAALERYPFASRLKFDDFFRDEADVQKHPNGHAFWDDPQSIKWDWLARALADLSAGKSTEIPDYSRKENKMVGTKIVHPAPVILVDGYQILCDERVREHLNMSLFFEIEESLQVSRRIQRQPDVDKDYLYQVMLPAYEAFLAPTKRFAHHVIDSAQTPAAVQAQAYEVLDPEFERLGLLANKG